MPVESLSDLGQVVQLRGYPDVKNTRRLPKVDYHCHISMTEYADPAHPTVVGVTPEEFLADLDEAGIQKAVVLSDSRTKPKGVAEFSAKAQGRLIGFGYVNPTLPGADHDLRKQREDLGLYGVKLYPCTDGYRADDPKAFKVYEVAQELDIPVLFHQAGMPVASELLIHTEPSQIDNIAKEFPDMRIVLAHLGYPRVDETLYVARKHKNVYCDISWPYGNINHPSYLYLLWRDLLTALNLGVINKLVFGTDYPGIRQKPYVDMLMGVNRYAPHQELRIPEEKLWAMLDVNAVPILPR